MNTFKVGDIVTGTKKASRFYRVTKEGWTGKVISVDGNIIKVTNLSGVVKYEVFADGFRLATREETIRAGFKWSDYISKTTKNVETIKDVIFNAPATIVL